MNLFVHYGSEGKQLISSFFFLIALLVKSEKKSRRFETGAPVQG